jgi:hypothetical protein
MHFLRVASLQEVDHGDPSSLTATADASAACWNSMISLERHWRWPGRGRGWLFIKKESGNAAHLAENHTPNEFNVLKTRSESERASVGIEKRRSNWVR